MIQFVIQSTAVRRRALKREDGEQRSGEAGEVQRNGGGHGQTFSEAAEADEHAPKRAKRKNIQKSQHLMITLTRRRTSCGIKRRLRIVAL